MKSELTEDHSWHPSRVTDEKLEKFEADIEAAAQELWQEDEDGDLPVQWQVTDRTRYRSFYNSDVPYEHHAETEDDHNEILSALVSNVRGATEQLDTYMKMRREAARQHLEDDPNFQLEVSRLIAEALPKRLGLTKLAEIAKGIAVWIKNRRFDWSK